MTIESPEQLDVPQLVLEAFERCREHLSPTPLEYSIYLSEKIDGEVWLKLDLMQRTSSFKFRGAINKILSLTESELDKGVVSASTGNYALAVAEAMKIRKRRVTIYIAEDIEPSRLELLRAHGLDLLIYGKLAWDAEKESRRVAEEQDKIYVSPYNDPIVVGGQGTCGGEISRQLPDVEAALFSCGAGGLLAGSAGWLKYHNPEVEAFGVSPENSPVMHESMRVNKIVDIETFHTLADTCVLLTTAVLLFVSMASCILTDTDPTVRSVVNRVSQIHYCTYQLDVENIGLGLYGGALYDIGYRNQCYQGRRCLDCKKAIPVH